MVGAELCIGVNPILSKNFSSLTRHAPGMQHCRDIAAPMLLDARQCGLMQGCLLANEMNVVIQIHHTSEHASNARRRFSLARFQLPSFDRS
jgi:hypothetical protein